MPFERNGHLQFVGAYALMDFLLAAMPITLVYKLQLDWRKKVGLCLLLGAGSL